MTHFLMELMLDMTLIVVILFLAIIIKNFIKALIK